MANHLGLTPTWRRGKFSILLAYGGDKDHDSSQHFQAEWTESWPMSIQLAPAGDLLVRVNSAVQYTLPGLRNSADPIVTWLGVVWFRRCHSSMLCKCACLMITVRRVVKRWISFYPLPISCKTRSATIDRVDRSALQRRSSMTMARTGNDLDIDIRPSAR